MWFVDFYYEGPLDQQIIPQFEEEMRRTIKANLPIKSQEMLFSNAIEFWKHHHNDVKAEVFEGVAGVGHFLLLDKILEEAEEVVGSTLEAGQVQILSLEEVGPDIYRVWGTSFETKDEAKDFKKKYNEYRKRKIGLPVPSDGGLSWKRKESQKLQKIIKVLFEECEKEKVSYLFTPPKEKFESHLELFEQAGGTAWRSFEMEQGEEIQNIAYSDDPFTTDFPLRDRQFWFFPAESLEGELISSLQLIDRLSKIFGINGEWHIHYDPKGFGSKKRFEQLWEGVSRALGNRKAIETKTVGSGLVIEFRLRDSLGRSWPGSEIALLEKPIVIGKREVEGFQFSCFKSIERWMSFVED